MPAAIQPSMNKSLLVGLPKLDLPGFTPEAFGRLGNNGSFAQLRPASLENMRSSGPGRSTGDMSLLMGLLGGAGSPYGKAMEKPKRRPLWVSRPSGREPVEDFRSDEPRRPGWGGEPRGPVLPEPKPPATVRQPPPGSDVLGDILGGGRTPVPGGEGDSYYEPGYDPATDPYRMPGTADEFADMVYQILYGGAGRADYTEAFNPLRTAMEEQVSREMADTLEQFGNLGAQYGSGSLEGVGEVGRRGAQDINTILGQLSYAADEANRGRMLQGAMQLGQQLYGSQEGAADRELQTLLALLQQETSLGTAGMGLQGQMAQLLSSLGGMFQGIDQGALDAAYQEWLRQEGGFTDEMLAFLGTPMPTSQPYYQSGWFDQFMPMFTAMMQGTPISDWFKP